MGCEISSGPKRLIPTTSGQGYPDLEGNPVVQAAFERYLEIISEASRHVPEEWKSRYGKDVPWRSIADFGNVLRHVYDKVDVKALWDAYEVDLDPLEAAIDAILAAHPLDD